jgi:hypothetical protein
LVIPLIKKSLIWQAKNEILEECYKMANVGIVGGLGKNLENQIFDPKIYELDLEDEKS